LQGLYPASQLMSQALLTQIASPLAGAGQAMPHPLQLAGFLVVSTQAPVQLIDPAGHELKQWPPLHTSFVPQGWLQPPQCAGFMSVLTHALPHWTNPVLQVPPHTLAAQVAMPLAGALQTLPQVLQLAVSMRVSMQAEPHRAKPASHSMPHFPAVQVPLPFIGVGQAIPQSLQFSALVVMSTHDPPQFFRVPEHAVVQLD
jgi:hypothetical protein